MGRTTHGASPAASAAPVAVASVLPTPAVPAGTSAAAPAAAAAASASAFASSSAASAPLLSASCGQLSNEVAISSGQIAISIDDQPLSSRYADAALFGGAPLFGGGGAGSSGGGAVALRDSRSEAGSADGGSGSGSETGGDHCWICFTGPREAVLLHCGHGGICYACAERCWKLRPRVCPLCRERVAGIARVAPNPAHPKLYVTQR
mmetsp:Transcript_5279/g.17134  ORF Transcript_5279/g.17134 Transcript_5279/m.17134 type:complete len:206 (-) Transcript_5279:144-761(-)